MEVRKLDRGFICNNFTGQISLVVIFDDEVKVKNIQELYNRHPNEVDPDLFAEALEDDPKFKEDKF